MTSVKLIGEIVKRKRVEEALKKSEERYHNLTEFANIGIIFSEDGKITQVNRKAEEIYGYSKNELIGQSPHILTPENCRKQHREMLDELIRLGKAKKAIFKEEGVRKDGSTFPIEISFSLAQPRENTIITIMKDITERKEMEEKLLQCEKLKSLGELAGGVAHDFNNVLAAILGRAQLLKMGIEPPPGKKKKRESINDLKKGLEIIEKAALDGAEIIRRIQEFSRRRDDDKNFTQVDINELLNNALEFTRAKWKNEAESKGTKIEIQKGFSPLPLVAGSAAELREVFTNLINNALDAMPHGGEIKIKTYKEDSHVAVKIENTGVGIPKVIRDKIFTPFFTTKGVQSTGLGLSISYRIIKRHRGTISVDSVEGQGTTFTIKLPIVKKTVEEETVKNFSREQRKSKILVIEDEEQVCNLLSAILKKGGHEVEVVTGGNQGIEMFEKKEFDLVFTDLGMRGVSGWQVAEKIKGINGGVPVVLITGWDIKQEESETKDNWEKLIVHKPFEIDQVLNVVQEGMIFRDRFKET